MDTNRRVAGAGLLVYAVGTFAGFAAAGAPGGDYSDSLVRTYIASSHWPTAFALSYVGAIGVLGLLVFGSRMRAYLGSFGDLLWGLTLAGTATSVVGWFLTGGVAVSMAEGGHQVQVGVPHPVIYTLTEVGNLLAVCSPAFFIGVAAIVLAVKGGLPGWLRGFSVIAGACGILAPFFFTYFVFVLWTLTFSVWAIATGRRTGAAAAPVQASLV